jgi:hypothetical protein
MSKTEKNIKKYINLILCSFGLTPKNQKVKPIKMIC